MKKFQLLAGLRSLIVASSVSVLLLTACGDDDSFSPVSRNRGYDYAYTSTKGLSETPCNEVREGREAVIGRDKDRYECRFDRTDSIYIWVGEYDTLTAEGREFSRPESSSSSDEESSDSEDSSSSRVSSSSYSSSYSSSSARSSSSESSSSSSYSSGSYSSSSSSGGLAKSIFGVEYNREFFNPDLQYGMMTDRRNDRIYKTVTIDGVVWMAENLNFVDTQKYPLHKEGAHCYNDDEENCELLGRLYDRAAAMNDSGCASGKSCNIGSGWVQGVCPDGWHIPTVSEAQALVDRVDSVARVLRSSKGWLESGIVKGEDLYGMSFVGTGYWEGLYDEYRSIGEYGFMWVGAAGTSQKYLLIRAKNDDAYINSYSTEVFLPVRCVYDNAIQGIFSSASSSSAKSSSSSVASSASKENFFNPDVSYGTLKDSRDGQVYKTIEINGSTWMAENLNFAGNTDWPLPKSHSYCYGGLDANCDLYGRLYDRAAAMNSTTCGYGKSCSLYNGFNRGVCPDGWHIPSEEEVDDLLDFTFGNRKTLRSADGWVVTESNANESGFSLVGSGVRADKNYVNQGRFAALWYYSTGIVQNYLVFSGVEDKMYLTENSKETIYISVRCVKGAGAEPASSASTKSSSSESSSSESSSSEESSSSFDKVVLFNSSVSYGEMTDGRDGKTYRTLNIAGRTWMAENLNFADSSKLPILEGNNRCYDDDPGECEAFGRLYSREAALNDSRCTCYNGTCPSMSGNVQGVCPDGWHIPSKSEAEQLANLNGNQAISLNSSYGWDADHRGNNSTGMSLVGTGVYQRQTGSVGFKGKGNYTDLWGYDASTPNGNWYLMDVGKGSTGNGIIAVEDDAGYDPFYTVRCVKN